MIKNEWILLANFVIHLFAISICLGKRRLRAFLSSFPFFLIVYKNRKKRESVENRIESNRSRKKFRWMVMKISTAATNSPTTTPITRTASTPITSSWKTTLMILMTSSSAAARFVLLHLLDLVFNHRPFHFGDYYWITQISIVR